MTNPNPDKPQVDHGLGWVTLDEGVQVSREWLTTHTPQLFTAWQQARTTQQRLRLAQQIQHIADEMENDKEHDPDEIDEWANLDREDEKVRIEWAESTLYEADLYIDPDATEDEVWTEIGTVTVTNAQRRNLEFTDADHHLVSVIDLDCDGVPSVLERSISTGNTSQWADLARSIDGRLTEGPDWPALAASLDRAATAGYDLVANLPRLAAQDGLPERHPARELQYRLMIECDAALPTADTIADITSTATTGENTRRPGLPPPVVPATEREAPVR
jgi:hypothetical protein